MVTKINKEKLEAISISLFRLGLVLTATAMPLEILPNRYISLLSWVINLLLLQWPLFVLLAGKNKIRISFKLDKLIIAALFLPLIAISLSALASVNMSVSFLELRSILVLVVRSLVIIFFSSPEDIKIFIKSVYIVTALVVAFAIFQYFGDLIGISSKITGIIKNYSSRGDHPFPRVHSFAHEPLYLANYLLISAGFIAGDIVKNRKNTKLWLKILFILTLSIIIITVARGAIYGMVLALIMLIIFVRDLSFIKQIFSYFALSVFFSLLMLGSASFIKNQFIIDDFSSHAASTADGSVTNRTATWKYAVKSFIMSPLLGVGGSNSQYYIGDHVPKVASSANVGLSKILVFNNTYLTYATEYGIIGLLSVIPLALLFIKIIKYIYNKRPNSYIVGVAAFFIAILLQALSFEMLLIMRFWVMTAILIALYRFNILNRAESI